ncbi:unnamed protein product [Ambrosiozyma monospora]|uniref:Unnamed protein product n=1 Tax=Ambrosiozyma monospora TaxID=43982 RepID=A0A9W6SZS3_AMBMO|nr:unnamed protein product [Ambrosiozyma monospora]
MPPAQVKKETTSLQDAPQFDFFPLRASNKDEIEETRYHIAKFHSNKTVDFKDFENPVRLHRKDPKNLQFQLSMKELEEKKIEDEKKETEKANKRREYLKKKGIVDIESIPAEQVDEDMEMETLSPEEKEKREYIKRKQEEELRKQQIKEKQQEAIAPDGSGRKAAAARKQIIKKKTRQIKIMMPDKPGLAIMKLDQAMIVTVFWSWIMPINVLSSYL